MTVSSTTVVAVAVVAARRPGGSGGGGGGRQFIGESGRQQTKSDGNNNKNNKITNVQENPLAMHHSQLNLLNTFLSNCYTSQLDSFRKERELRLT